MASVTNIANLLVTLNANTLQYDAAMRKAMHSTEVTMRSINRAVALGTAAMVASFALVGVASVRAFAEFESSFAGVEKTVNATKEELDELSESFRQMSREIPINVNEINRVGEAAGQLGIELKNIKAFTKTMLELGIATNLTAEEAATSLARLANITQLPQTEFDKLGSTIVALGNSMATTEKEIVEMSLRLAAAGTIVGMTEADILGLAAAMSSVGIRAEEGGTAFSKIMLQINTAVKSGSEELTRFAEVSDLAVSDFKDLFENDASGAIIKFLEGLDKINKAGGDVAGELASINLEGVRVVGTLLRLAGAGDLVTRSFKIANDGRSENIALTAEVQKRYETFESKVQVLANRLNDMFIIIGSKLVPVLKELMALTGQNADETARFNTEMGSIGETMATVTRIIIALTTDTVNGFKLLWSIAKIVLVSIGEHVQLLAKGIEIVFLGINTIIQNMISGWKKLFLGLSILILKVFVGIGDNAKAALNPIIEGINSVIEATNRIARTDFKPIVLLVDSGSLNDELDKATKSLFEFSQAEKDATANLHQAQEEFTILSDNISRGSIEFRNATKELGRLSDKGSSTVKLYHELNAVTITAVEVTNQSSDATKALADAQAEALATQQKWADAIDASNKSSTDYIVITAKMREEAMALTEAIKTPFEKGIEALARYDNLLKAGLITQEQFNKATAQAFGTTTAELGLPQDQSAGFETGAFGGAGLAGFALGGPEGEEFAKFQAEEQALQEHMKKLEEIRVGGEESMSKQQLAVIDALQQQTSEKLAENIEAQNALIFATMQDTSDMLLGVLKETAGEQSGIYKAMFAATKAFAIAESIVSIQSGIAKALSLGFPQGIFAAISVASQAAGIISTIQGTVANFEGGGLTPSGSRAGGVDGRGGFMAVLHPDEKVTDLKQQRGRGEGAGGGLTLNVDISNTASDVVSVTATKSNDGKDLSIMVKRVDKELASNVRNGRGELPKAIAQTFGVARGRA